MLKPTITLYVNMRIVGLPGSVLHNVRLRKKKDLLGIFMLVVVEAMFATNERLSRPVSRISRDSEIFSEEIFGFGEKFWNLGGNFLLILKE